MRYSKAKNTINSEEINNSEYHQSIIDKKIYFKNSAYNVS
jgi:hypothetical protein